MLRELHSFDHRTNKPDSQVRGPGSQKVFDVFECGKPKPVFFTLSQLALLVLGIGDALLYCCLARRQHSKTFAYSFNTPGHVSIGCTTCGCSRERLSAGFFQ